MPRPLFMTLVLVGSVANFALIGADAQAGEPGPPFYTLDAVIDLALERNPAIAGATSVMEQSHGQQVAAGA
ncbi:MAG: hypothetical protein HY205_02710, partial [Nitrospirae bacterium]|nr:hypothetical protein [Nitrospirota bacterium]